MAPPTIHDDTEDLDDLDDVLDQFNPTSAPSTAAPPPAATRSAPNPPPPTSSASSFPDPDDDELPGDGADELDGLDPAIAKDLEQGMKAFFDAFGAGGANNIPGLDGPEGGGGGGDFDDEEFRKAMEEILQNGGAGGGGLDGAGTDTKELQDLMAALGMGANAGPPPPLPTSSSPSTAAAATSTASKSTLKGKDKSVNPEASSSSTTPANFQDAIAASLSKMQSSSSTASAAAQQSQAAADGSGNLASMLAGLSGMPDLSQLGDLGSEEGLQGMLDEMMKQLMSREMLYEPLKELSGKYPAYLESARSTLSPTDLERYEKQHSIVVSIVSKFEEPGADKPLDQQSAQEKELSEQRTEEVVDLVAKMNECGAPPKEIMGEMPPGMELGPDGAPKVPECTIC